MATKTAELLLDKQRLWKMILEKRDSYQGVTMTPEQLQEFADQALINAAMFAVVLARMARDPKLLPPFGDLFGDVLVEWFNAADSANTGPLQDNKVKKETEH